MDNDEYIYEIEIRNAAISSKNESDWLNAINQMINNEYIRDVAIFFNKEQVFLAAINQMVNDEYIRDVAIASKNENVCHSAINQMVNDEYLYEVKQALNSLIVERERKARIERERIKREREEKAKKDREENERKEREERAKVFALYEKKSPQPTMIRENPCDRCMLKHGPYCITPPFGTNAYRDVNTNCNLKETIRTKVADYYVCPKSGRPKEPSGWYEGRGY